MPTVEQAIGWDKELFVGAEKTLVWTILSELGAAVDVTGWTLHFVARLTRYASPIVVEFDVAPVAGEETLGHVSHHVASAESKNVKPGTYWYGLARTNNGAWDVKGDGDRIHDPRTHAGIVLAVDEDGTIY